MFTNPVHYNMSLEFHEKSRVLYCTTSEYNGQHTWMGHVQKQGTGPGGTNQSDLTFPSYKSDGFFLTSESALANLQAFMEGFEQQLLTPKGYCKVCKGPVYLGTDYTEAEGYLRCVNHPENFDHIYEIVSQMNNDTAKIKELRGRLREIYLAWEREFTRLVQQEGVNPAAMPQLKAHITYYMGEVADDRQDGTIN